MNVGFVGYMSSNCGEDGGGPENPDETDTGGSGETDGFEDDTCDTAVDDAGGSGDGSGDDAGGSGDGSGNDAGGSGDGTEDGTDGAAGSDADDCTRGGGSDSPQAVTTTTNTKSAPNNLPLPIAAE